MREAEVNVGLLVAHSPATGPDRLREFAESVAAAARPELEATTAHSWAFHVVEPTRLGDDSPRRPSSFLDDASLRMAEGPYDVVVVITDVAVVSRRRAVEAGLASPASRIAVLSARKLLLTPRGEPTRSLEEANVRANAAVLVLHLMGHLLGLPHTSDPEDAMAPYAFDEARRGPPRFGNASRRRIGRAARRLPEGELVEGGPLREFGFHLSSGARHADLVLRSLWKSRAPLLPLSLPGLATAAVVPTFILVFTAEIWDVGLNMANDTAWSFAVAAVLASTWYLTSVQNLYFPRKEKRVITTHTAVVNVTIFLSMLLAVVGLFAMVSALMLIIEFLVFPADLMSTWPTLEDPVVDTVDRLRLAGFISSVGVLTDALAGGLESRAVIRHLALFLQET